MYGIIKRFLFLLPAETAHYFTLFVFEILLKIPGVKGMFKVNRSKTPKVLFGLEFPNMIGLAAGFDKNAKHLDALETLGFGFIEVGTVTPKPQSGNDKPRLFRLVKDEAIINRMGFNNDGVEVMVDRLKKYRGNAIIGGNIGKNKVTPNEHAVEDYLKCFKALHDHVDYFVVNVSSPNTPGLRELQEKDSLFEILNTLVQENKKQVTQRPILLKIAPDLNESQLDDIVEIVKESQIQGIIATNTTISRDGLNSDGDMISAIGNGGLSGRPVKERSDEVVRYIRSKAPEMAIIGVGGIHSTKDARDKIEAGADLVQVYSGFIYEGPKLVKRLVEQL